MSIPAGGTAVVEVAYNPLFDLRGTYPDTKQAVVYVDGYNQPAAVLTVSGVVRCSVLADPSTVEFPHAKSGRSTTVRVVLHLDASSRIRVNSAAGASRGLTCRLGRAVQSQTGYKTQYLYVTVGPHTPAGPIDCDIHLGTNDKAVRDLSIPVTGQVTGPVTSIPDAFFFSSVRRGFAASARVWLMQKSSHSLIVDRASSASPYVRAVLSRAWGHLVLKATILSSAPAGELSSAVSVFARGRGVVLSIPVNAYIN